MGSEEKQLMHTELLWFSDTVRCKLNVRGNRIRMGFVASECIYLNVVINVNVTFLCVGVPKVTSQSALFSLLHSFLLENYNLRLLDALSR